MAKVPVYWQVFQIQHLLTPPNSDACRARAFLFLIPRHFTNACEVKLFHLSVSKEASCFLTAQDNSLHINNIKALDQRIIRLQLPSHSAGVLHS